MRIKKIKNISKEDVVVDIDGDVKIILTPNSEMKNIRISNLDEIKDRVQVTTDLGEICERSTNKTKLYD